MNHHLHNFIWGILFSASYWNYVNYYHLYLFVCAMCKSISPERLFQGRSKEETGQNKMSGWLSGWRWVFGSQQLPSLEGQPLQGSLRWKCSAGDLMCRMLSALGAEPGAGSRSRESGPAPASHLASHPCSFGLFFQRLVH